MSLFYVTRSEKTVFCSMYVRLKTNRSGSTTAVVVEKKAGRQSTEAELKSTDEFLSRIENVFHEGSKYKGHTMLPVVSAFVEKSGLEEFVVVADAKWDVLKDYISNAALTSSAVVEAYHQLYNVEQSFRISKY